MAKRQRSLFEYEIKLDKLSGIGDPLERLNKRIPWDKLFRNIIGAPEKTTLLGGPHY